MLIHWQSHQDYLFFLHETKVHLDSSQRTRLRLEFGPVCDKLRLLDLDPVIEYLSAFYPKKEGLLKIKFRSYVPLSS